MTFYDLGWVTGSGGGMSIKVEDKVFVAPSGVQKEDLVVQDIFTLSANDKDVIIEAPETPNLKQSAYVFYLFILVFPNFQKIKDY
jgi:ribulose-5-phosphate 4-epimerase/fuculose-1-phosphate aldolase